MPIPTPNAFSARSQTWKLHSAEDSIERHLSAEVGRAGAGRAFVVTSPSIAAKTETVARVQAALGDRFAGCFDGIENDSTYKSVAAATEAAREAKTDLLVAVGGGSVIVAVRAVDIFLCEQADPFELMTQYPEGRAAFSPRLNTPKLPIINIVTTPTSAMNRAGSGLKNEELDHRMEYFDPKTRPAALLWDWQALAETPASIIRSTATTTFSTALAATLQDEPNPLVEGDRDQAFHLAERAYSSLATSPHAVAPRLDLCAAAFLANRAEDDQAGGLAGRGVGQFIGDYAVSTALHVRYPDVGQGESTSVLGATAMRRAAGVPDDLAFRAASALKVRQPGMDGSAARLAAADELERLYKAAGMPVRVGELGIARGDLQSVAEQTAKNFNANAGARSEADQVRRALELLEAAW